MVTYADLNRRHPSYREDRAAELQALYEGGEKLEALYGRLIPRRPRERDQHYQLRVTEAEYRNYLGPIIDYFKSMLFVSRPVLKSTTGAETEPTDPGGDWNAFREDCDGGGTDIDALFGQVLTDAMIHRTGWCRLRQPDDGGAAPGDAAEFERRGLGNIKFGRVDPIEVYDWDEDDNGRLAFANVHACKRRRRGPIGDRSQVVETWEWLTPEGIETFQLQWEDTGSPPPPDTAVPSLGIKPHSFGAVPLICLDLPPALWVANRLRSPQLAHFRKVCAQSWSLAATAYAMPVVKVKDPEDYKAQASGAGYEIILQQEDSYGWEAPPTDHFASLDAEIKACKDEIFRIAHQMAMGVENNAAAVGRSADSKASDAEVTRVVLVAFSRIVKETIELGLDLRARARGEKLEWSVEGLDDFAAFDLGAFLTQLVLLDKAGGVMSRTFSIHKQTRIAEAMLKDVDEETKATIRKEIEAGTTDPAEDARLEREAAAAVFAKPTATPPNGAQRPGKTPPTPAA